MSLPTDDQKLLDVLLQDDRLHPLGQGINPLNLSRITKMGYGDCKKALTDLEDKGYVQSYRYGSITYYRAKKLTDSARLNRVSV